MIRGTTELVAHIGYPTHTFKSPMIYNPYFEHAGIDAVVVPMSCESEQYPAFLKSVFTPTNVRGAIITMLEIRTGSRDPAGHDVVVNATPLGMKEGDPM